VPLPHRVSGGVSQTFAQLRPNLMSSQPRKPRRRSNNGGNGWSQSGCSDSMEVSNAACTPYDEVLYPSGFFPQTHPDRFATVAHLRGMSLDSIECCRILELGCGTADNLIAMAFQFPASEFVGIDLGRVPIASGQALVTELGMRNVTLLAMDLCDSSLSQLGEFSFIIVHGVYSWVPQSVRERILQICQKTLTAKGIAYISYNTYPGCHFRDLVRHMMRFHTQKFEGIAEKAAQARALVKFLADSRMKPDYYTESLRAQLGRVTTHRDESLYHDDLNAFAQPFYFHEFMEEAARYDLQYVGEAIPDDSDRTLFTPEALRRMSELQGASEIVREQYKDFLRGTGFRQTLLCKKEIQLAPAFLDERIPALFAMCDPETMNDPVATEDSPVECKSSGGRTVETANSLWRIALSFICSQWPCAVSFGQILEKVRQTDPNGIIDSIPATETATIAAALKASYLSGEVSLRVHPPNLVNRVSERPAISRLAHEQLRQNRPLSSQLHRSIKITDFAFKHFMSLLDGTRDVETLSAEMTAFRKSSVSKSQMGDSIEPGALEGNMKQGIENTLASLMRAGVLVR
jgi:SAM-dependent methyltransferase/methyltransferase-like protein